MQADLLEAAAPGRSGYLAALADLHRSQHQQQPADGEETSIAEASDAAEGLQAASSRPVHSRALHSGTLQNGVQQPAACVQGGSDQQASAQVAELPAEPAWLGIALHISCLQGSGLSELQDGVLQMLQQQRHH